MKTRFTARAVLTVLAGFVPLSAGPLLAEDAAPAGVVRITDRDAVRPVSHHADACEDCDVGCDGCVLGDCGDACPFGDACGCGDACRCGDGCRCNDGCGRESPCGRRLRELFTRGRRGNECHDPRCQYCAAGSLRGHFYGGHPSVGLFHRTYPADPYHFDARDGRAYSAYGYGVPMAVPLAPVVQHTYNYGWGIPSSRITPVSRMPGM